MTTEASHGRRRTRIEHVTAKLDVSERFACRVQGQHRSVQRRTLRVADDEAALRESIIGLARQYGQYGYRLITALLPADGWSCNYKRVERIWRAEGLKVPARQPMRGRLWLNDGSCVRLRPERPNREVRPRWMSSPASAWPPGWRAGSGRQT